MRENEEKREEIDPARELFSFFFSKSSSSRVAFKKQNKKQNLSKFISITSLFLRFSQSSAAAESVVLREDRDRGRRGENFFELFLPLSLLSLSLFLCELASKFTL